MKTEATPIDIAAMPDVARLAHEVAETGVRRLLTEHGIPIAELGPVRQRRMRRGRPKPLTMDDPIWAIVGSIKEDIGSDVSANKHKYLAEAYASEFE